MSSIRIGLVAAVVSTSVPGVSAAGEEAVSRAVQPSDSAPLVHSEGEALVS